MKAAADERLIAANRRSTELGLVLMAALVTTGAYALVALGRTATLPANLLPFLAVIVGLLLVAHLATRRLAPGADGVLLPIAALLNGIGYVFIARIDNNLAGLQANWTFIGIGAALAGRGWGDGEIAAVVGGNFRRVAAESWHPLV